MTTEAQIHPGISGMDDLVGAGRTICVIENSAYGNWLRSESYWASDINLRWTKGTEMASALRDGLCDGLIDRDLMVDYHLSDLKNCKLVKAGPTFWSQSMGIGFARHANLADFTHHLSLWILNERAKVSSLMSRLLHLTLHCRC